MVAQTTGWKQSRCLSHKAARRPLTPPAAAWCKAKVQACQYPSGTAWGMPWGHPSQKNVNHRAFHLLIPVSFVHTHPFCSRTRVDRRDRQQCTQRTWQRWWLSELRLSSSGCRKQRMPTVSGSPTRMARSSFQVSLRGTLFTPARPYVLHIAPTSTALGSAGQC